MMTTISQYTLLSSNSTYYSSYWIKKVYIKEPGLVLNVMVNPLKDIFEVFGKLGHQASQCFCLLVNGLGFSASICTRLFQAFGSLKLCRKKRHLKSCSSSACDKRNIKQTNGYEQKDVWLMCCHDVDVVIRATWIIWWLSEKRSNKKIFNLWTWTILKKRGLIKLIIVASWRNERNSE